MRRILAAGLIGLAAALHAAAAAAAPPLVLRLISQETFDHPHGRILQTFKKEVEGEARDLVIEIYPVTHLFKDEEAPGAIAAGTAVEMGALHLEQFADRVPAAAAFAIPFLFETDARALAAGRRGAPLRTAIDAAILNTGVRVLLWRVGGGSVLLSRDAPVRRPSDLAGKVVRVAGEASARFAERLGATPVPMPEAAGAAAVRRGTVQAALAFAPVDAAAEGMGAVTATLGARRVDVVAINEKAWRSLSPHQRAAIEAAAQRAEAAREKALAEESGQGCGGIRPAVCLTVAERVLWRAAARPLIEDFLRHAGTLNGALRAAAGPLK